MKKKDNIQTKAEKINNVLFDIIKAVSTTTSLEAFYTFIHNALNSIIIAPNFFIAIYKTIINTSISFQNLTMVMPSSCNL